MMVDDALFIIPARGGSKGVPGKNIKLLNGKPLIYYSIDAAREVALNEDICVSTDSLEIKNVVEEYGLKVPFIRPIELASDTAGTYEVLLHALDYYNSNGRTYKFIVILQPTSPFRKGQHIKEAFQLYSGDLDMVVSVKEASSNPYYSLFEENEEGFLRKSKEGNFMRRQDCPKVYEYNGAVYIINVDSLRKFPLSKFSKIVKYVMNDNESLDIDTMLDWELAEILMRKVVVA